MLRRHRRLLRAVGALVPCGGRAARAPALEGHETPAAVRLAAEVRLALATLRRHEAEENELLQKVYCDSVGTVD